MFKIEGEYVVLGKEDIVGIKCCENYLYVYVVKGESGFGVDGYVFFVRGYGLWLMLYGFFVV